MRKCKEFGNQAANQHNNFMSLIDDLIELDAMGILSFNSYNLAYD